MNTRCGLTGTLFAIHEEIVGRAATDVEAICVDKHPQQSSDRLGKG